MGSANLADRLATLPNMAAVPREELEWLSSHGDVEVHEPGAVIAPKDTQIEKLWIVLSGYIVIRVDRGIGPRLAMEWGVGEVTGKLPYSRMTGPPGDTIVEKKAELLALGEELIPALIQSCPMFTSCTVHMMLDRARRFNSSDLQDEKMISLGKLAAGLAHELNNPASAIMRSAKFLRESLKESDAASLGLGAADVANEVFDKIEHLRSISGTQPNETAYSPLQRADREDEFTEWLERHGVNAALAAPLADTSITFDDLDALAGQTSPETLNRALRWIAAGCVTNSLAGEIEQAATRVYDIVAAVKRFTYMDHLAGPESVDVEAGLRDTVRVLASKVKSKGTTIVFDFESDLPCVQATGGELNQVWMNLIDNALDAIPASGKIDIRAFRKLDRVIVCIIDDGPGIPPDIIAQIFDPFFTTKPPGKGTGLGLEIARQLVRRHLGDITVRSQSGRTEFRVSLASYDSARPEYETPR